MTSKERLMSKVDRYLFKLPFIVLIAAFLFTGDLLSQALHDQEHTYYPVKDNLVKEKLEQWQDLKFGLMMTWGPYSQWGIVESWSLCPEDYGWCQRRAGANPENYFEYKKEYENLKTTFNPVQFNPEKWAKAAQAAGMKYVVAMAKHHDGFCMFDTKTTTYKITDKDCPFHSNPRADVTKEIFEAFRQQGMWAGVYYSKPDWSSPYYWDPYFPPLDRNVNYDPHAYPERWEKFVQFTQTQIMELMTDYGDIDILWLDGGWVAKQEKDVILDFYDKSISNASSGFLKHRIVNQDILMNEIAMKAREKQPGLIVVDRAVPGENENYLTPENRVPEQMIPFPWESCIIAGGGWSWVPDAKYKSAREVVQMLVDIVSKGGNLLLDIAPNAQGEWDEDAYQLLRNMGDWMKVNDEAIYNSRAIAPYKDGKVCLTQNRFTNAVYAVYLSASDETQPPAKIWLNYFQPAPDAAVTMLGVKEQLKWEKVGNVFVVDIPESVRKNPPCKHAWTIKIL